VRTEGNNQGNAKDLDVRLQRRCKMEQGVGEGDGEERAGWYGYQNSDGPNPTRAHEGKSSQGDDR